LLASGIELYDDAREFGFRHYGVNYFNPSDVKPASVDIRLLRHVLEHIKDPVSFLNSYARFMSSSGVLFHQITIFQTATQKLKSRICLDDASCNLYGYERISEFDADSLVCFLESVSSSTVKA
jgi:hypothetical protein